MKAAAGHCGPIKLATGGYISPKWCVEREAIAKAKAACAKMKSKCDEQKVELGAWKEKFRKWRCKHPNEELSLEYSKAVKEGDKQKLDELAVRYSKQRGKSEVRTLVHMGKLNNVGLKLVNHEACFIKQR